jgi:2-polyprenyl-6-methoxyphenol hydroxylase-like FAD-dependent oxidoreductase
LSEKNIRSVFEKDPNVTFKEGIELTGISETQDEVTVKVKDEDGKELFFTGKFLVGADGKVGYVRKHYLEAKGVRQLDSEKYSPFPKASTLTAVRLPYVQWWVAVNWKMTLPTPESHPSFPLWELGYTPQQVYDEFFPFDFRFVCNIHRPSICGRFGIPEKRLWRFEYIINEGEDPWAMADPQVMRDIIYPYITHKGSRYGLKEDVMFPEDCITVLRARPFKFKAQVANKWVVGRVMVAGDAAHNFPPFGGQGIASGFRDSLALAWRLALITKRRGINYDELLTGWYVERKQQVDVCMFPI